MTTSAEPATETQTQLDLATAATLPADDVLHTLDTSRDGLTTAEASDRLARFGPNAIRTHSVRAIAVLANQLRNPFMALLLVTAVASAALGQTTDAVIIFLICGLSVGVGFVSEYRSSKAVEELHDQVHHQAIVLRDGSDTRLDVTNLVPGDVVRLGVGDVVPADLRLLESNDLECDESVLTGESLPAEKRTETVDTPESPLDLPTCAFMGTVVRAGNGVGVVVQTGSRTVFGKIAVDLSAEQPQTSFQRGLDDFSVMLVRVAAVLAVTIFVVNVAIGRSPLQSALFALSISIGLTPQLLPAIVTVSLSTGAKRLAERQVIVKRLVAIEDLGNIDVFFTDKTGTLTEGTITFEEPLDAAGRPADGVLVDGLLCNDAVLSNGKVVDGNPLDRALWEAPAAARQDVSGYRRVAAKPFDYQRRIASAIVEDAGCTRTLIAKGAPELLLARCNHVPAGAQSVLDRQFAMGRRVVAVAVADAAGKTEIEAADEQGLELAGFLTFLDPPKPGAATALARLRSLGVEVKVITGDNVRVAATVCSDLGLEVGETLVGTQLDALDDDALAAALPRTTVFARVTPEQKSRVINAQRGLGNTVGFMGDGVNDAVALHDADVGISVDTATDVAKDAADIVLLSKDLDVLAGGISEGRRIFANTIKYVLMATSSNFGNMFSAGISSFFLTFLPLLPTQILLNNLLYDVSEMTIPTDEVDEEQLRRPSHWDIGMIKRFMFCFGPISSLFDFGTFAILLYGFHAHATLFHSGWFVESLATQSLAIFAIRTRRIPFLRSRAGTPLLVSTLAVVGIAFALPFSPLAKPLGFTALPWTLVAVIWAIIPTYLLTLEVGKYWFYRLEAGRQPTATGAAPTGRQRVQRRAARWTLHAPRYSPGRVKALKGSTE
ncbi:MAG TPA: magnesium-translocating P-type ATPase [Gaiellaceae bacterium]|nr:magnesium-translocating P-type ATPase [Gaiellaceae bacterium]